jgi:DNA-binding transcriptional ArsR family regulator
MLGRVTTAETFAVVAEPGRRRILDLLLVRDRAVGELVDELTVSQPAVSRHLRVLRDAGLVDVRAEAQRRVYRVRPEALRAIDDWLAPYRARWSEHLDALATHLDAMDDEQEST